MTNDRVQSESHPPSASLSRFPFNLGRVSMHQTICFKRKTNTQSSTTSGKGKAMIKGIETPKNHVVMSNFNKKLLGFQDKYVIKHYPLIE